jgi:SHS2 domain-containing protein
MFEVLEHPADIGFRAFGATRSELFLNAALALLSIADQPEAAMPRERYVFSVSSPDLLALFVDWLSEVLYWFDGKRIAFHHFEILTFTERELRAAGYGEPRDPERHRAKLIVKGVTYHQLKIEQRGTQWIAEVYLDI